MIEPHVCSAHPIQHQNPLLRWAKTKKYPQLVLSDGTIIRHGHIAWRVFVGKRNKRKILLAWQRVHEWQKLEGTAHD